MAMFTVEVHTTELVKRTYEVEAETVQGAVENYWNKEPINEEGDQTEIDLIEVFDEEGNEIEVK